MGVYRDSDMEKLMEERNKFFQESERLQEELDIVEAQKDELAYALSKIQNADCLSHDIVDGYINSIISFNWQ